MWVYMRKMELRYWWEYDDEKTRINKLNAKPSLIPWGLRAPIWKINFCSSVLQLSELPGSKERPQTAIRCLELLGRLKCLATGLDASVSFLSTSRRCSRNRSPCRLPVSPMYSLLQ